MIPVCVRVCQKGEYQQCSANELLDGELPQKEVASMNETVAGSSHARRRHRVIALHSRARTLF